MKLHSLYIHIPFCTKRCSYCDFNTYIDRTGLSSAYLNALREEINKIMAHKQQLPLKTIYIGGGTPSLINLNEYDLLFDVIQKNFYLQDQIEISVEANPGTLSKPYLSGLRKMGVNRLSLGMQSAHPDHLKLLGREHTFQTVRNSVHWARESGFKNINLDLIYGIPGQTLDDWQNSLQSAVSLLPDHLSLYSLTLENSVPLERWILQGKTPAQDSDLMADMYEWALDYLAEAGFYHYEISNWARMKNGLPLNKCEHNIQYWLNQPYLGLGAGAHGYSQHVRTENIHRIPDYIRRCRSKNSDSFPLGPALKTRTNIDRYLEMQETMIMGLRLIDIGVSTERFFNRFNIEIENIFGKELEYLQNLNLIEYGGKSHQNIRLTKKGYLLGNQAFMQFVG